MSIQWGNWEDSGGNGMRVGVEVNIPNVGTNWNAVTITFDVYTQNRYSYSDPMGLNFGGGAGSGSYNFTNNEANGVSFRVTRSWTYTYGNSEYGSSPGNRNFSATIFGAYNNVTPTSSVTFAIPARPYDNPAAPTAVTAVRNSDAQITVSWTRHSTTQAPYTSQTVQMRTYNNGWGNWSTVGTPGQGATSFVQTGLIANRQYQFQVRANNSVGSSGYNQSGQVRMTPAAPSAVKSARTSDGTGIVTTWTRNDQAWGAISSSVQRSNNGGAWTTVASGLGGTTYTDTAPPSGTNQYRVRVDDATSSLSSAWVTGNSTTVAVPPLAPTNLAPNGLSADLQFTPVPITWLHNPGTDGAAQSHFSIRYSTDGGTTWVALPGATNVASTNSAYTIPAGTLSNGRTYQYQVQTQGATSAAFGPWSASAVVTGSTTPTVTLVAGQPGATSVTLPLVVGWNYNQDSGSPQVAWQAQALDPTGAVVGDLAGSDNSASATFTGVPLANGTTYTVQVRAQSGAGLWSKWATTTTTVQLAPPANTYLTPIYQPCSGVMSLNLTSDPAAPNGSTSAVDHVTVERQINGTGDWVVVADGVPTPNTVLDLTPITHGSNAYRVTSWSSQGGSTVMPIVYQDGVDGTDDLGGDGLWVFLSWGDGFANVARLHGDPSIAVTAGRTRVAQPLLGRAWPVLLVGDNASLSVAVSGSLHYWSSGSGCAIPDDPDCYWDSPPDDWQDCANTAEVVLYRDYAGRRIFGQLEDVTVSEVTWPNFATVSFTVNQVDFTETPGVVATASVPGVVGASA